jgi:murein DD-endopeptidase MepM/ murein hydrolase activator NlpD
VFRLQIGRMKTKWIVLALVLVTVAGVALVFRMMMAAAAPPAAPASRSAPPAIRTADLTPEVAPAADSTPRPITLELPIACDPGRTCAVQSYMDLDPGPGVQDYRCGARSYDKHGGVDIRVPDLAAMHAGAQVLASADGTVLRVRDGVRDVSIREDNSAVASGQDCGNAVVIGHSDGWETQYCHMRQGSVRVKPGQTVKTGEPIGLVGLSGNTEFPHIHLSVRQGSTTIDPFAYGAPSGSCGAGQSLWSPAVAAKLAYRPREVLNAGFAGAPVDMAAIEAGSITPAARSGAALVAYVRAIGLQAGDVQSLSVRGPGGAVVADQTPDPLPRNQAQRFMFVGRKTPPEGWPAGTYSAHYTVRREGVVVLERRFDTRLQAGS